MFLFAKKMTLFACVFFTLSLLSFSSSVAERLSSAKLKDSGISLSSIKVPAQKTVAKESHVVFFIHGLMGDETTFGDLKEVLNKEYVDRHGIDLHFVDVTYPTKPKTCNQKIFNKLNYHPFHFAQITNTTIINYFYENKNNLSRNTAYSLVVHSQGGLAATSFLNSCFLRDSLNIPRCQYSDGVQAYANFIGKNAQSQSVDLEKEGCREYSELFKKFSKDRFKKARFSRTAPPNIQALITLGTPFWGSPTANQGMLINSTKAKVLPTTTGAIKLLVKFFAGVPLEQIARLAVSGEGTTLQHMLMVNRKSTPESQWTKDTPWINPYTSSLGNEGPKNLKVYNIAGLLDEAIQERGSPVDKLADAVLVHSSRYESDIIVGAPSARMDFLFRIENRDPQKTALSGMADFSRAYIPIKGSHIPFRGISGIAKIDNDPYGLSQIYAEADTENNENSELVMALTPNEIQSDEKIDWTKKTHPGFLAVRNIFNQLLGVDLVQKEIFSDEQKQRFYAEKLENFSAEIKLLSPVGYHRRFPIVEDDITISTPNPEAFSDLALDGYFDAYAEGHGVIAKAMKLKDHYYQSYYHIGKFSDAYAYYPKEQTETELKTRTRQSLLYKVNIPGFEIKHVANQVLPSFNSYAEAYLVPYHPIKNNQTSFLSDQDLRVIATFPKSDINTGEVSFRILSLNSQNKLVEVKKTWTQLTPHEISLVYQDKFRGRCYVGMTGFITPRDKMRHSILMSDGTIVTKERKILANKKRSQMKKGLRFWEKYASNKNQIYTRFMANDRVYPIKKLYNNIPHRNNLDFREDTLKRFYNEMDPGTYLEILGRYSIGRIDQRSKTGRSCTAQELRNDQISATQKCSVTTIDRYLVTSPQIREQDGIPANNFYDVGLSQQGELQGLRWVNVADVDIFKGDYYVKDVGGASYKECLRNNPGGQWSVYPTPAEAVDRYYSPF